MGDFRPTVDRDLAFILCGRPVGNLALTKR
jgi:hypothetical protein